MIKLTFLVGTIFISNFIFADGGENFMFDKNWTTLASIKTNNFHKDFKALQDADIDIAGVDIKNKIIDILLDEYDYHRLSKLGYDVEVTQTKGVTKGPDEEYKNPEEIAVIVEDFAHRYPDITHRVSIGKSLEGRDIWALKISDNPELSESFEPAVLFNSMHHAREIMTPEVSIDIIETLVTGYNSDSKVTAWIDENEIWVIPMFNVDGNNKMWNHDRWWRKNNRGGYGVDLNRNYPTGWNKCNGSSGRRSSQTYRGTSPGSEPETQAMMDFITEVRPVFNISYHAYSELVLYPFGCSPERTGTSNIVEGIGKDIGKLLDYEPGTPWELLYNADGGDIDWMYDQYQVIPYVIEVNSRSQGFQPSYKKWRDKTVIRNRAGWQYLLDRVSKSGIRGVLTREGKSISNFTLNVYKLDPKRTFFQKYVGQKSGAYHLVLEPGEFELEFIVDGNIIHKQSHVVGEKLSRVNVSL